MEATDGTPRGGAPPADRWALVRLFAVLVSVAGAARTPGDHDHTERPAGPDGEQGEASESTDASTPAVPA